MDETKPYDGASGDGALPEFLGRLLGGVSPSNDTRQALTMLETMVDTQAQLIETQNRLVEILESDRNFWRARALEKS